MLNITDEEKLLWQSDSQHKEYEIVFKQPNSEQTISILYNEDLVGESLKLTQILEDNNTLTFAGVNSDYLTFECIDLIQDYRGCDIEVWAKLSGTTYPKRLFFFGPVLEQENQTHEDVTTSITAYDLISVINRLNLTSWWNELSLPTNATFRDYIERIIDKFATETGCEVFSELDYSLLANIDLVLSYKPDLIADFQEVTGEMLIKWIAQAANVYITMQGRKLRPVKIQPMKDGLRPHVGLRPHPGLFPYGGSYDKAYSTADYIKVDYEPYRTNKIDQVVVNDKVGIGQGQYPTEKGDNVFYLDSNPFLWAMDMQQAAENIYQRIKDVYFTPSKIEAVGLPFIELGDVCKLYTQKNIIYSYILKRTLKGMQALIDDYANESEQVQQSHEPSFASVTSDNGKSILKIQADIVEINELKASKIYVDEEVAKKVSAEELYVSGTTVINNAHIDNLDASKITSGRISTDHLSTSVITTGNLSAQSISASQISGGSLSGSLISGGGATLNSLNCSEFLCDYGGTQKLVPVSVSVGGKARIILATQ